MNENFPLGCSWVGAGPEAEALQDAIVFAVVEQALYQWAVARVLRRHLAESGASVRIDDGILAELATRADLDSRDGVEGLVVRNGGNDRMVYQWFCPPDTSADWPLSLFHVRTNAGNAGVRYGDGRDAGYVVSVACSPFGWSLKGLPDLRRGPDPRLVDILLLLQGQGHIAVSAVAEELAMLRGIADKARVLREDARRRWSQMTSEEQAAARQRVREQILATDNPSAA